MDAGSLDMFHDAADDGPVAVRNGIHIHFNGILQELVDQHGVSRGGQDGQPGKILQFRLVVYDLHGSPAKHIRRHDHHRVTDIVSNQYRL